MALPLSCSADRTHQTVLRPDTQRELPPLFQLSGVLEAVLLWTVGTNDTNVRVKSKLHVSRVYPSTLCSPKNEHSHNDSQIDIRPEESIDEIRFPYQNENSSFCVLPRKG